MSSPTECDWSQVMRILQYVKGTIDQGLFCILNDPPTTLLHNSESDLANNVRRQSCCCCCWASQENWTRSLFYNEDISSRHTIVEECDNNQRNTLRRKFDPNEELLTYRVAQHTVIIIKTNVHHCYTFEKRTQPVSTFSAPKMKHG